MRRRLHATPIALLLVLTAGLLAGACGGDDAASQDPGTVLEETFRAGKKVESGRLSVRLAVDARGSAQVAGPIELSLSGPFQSTGEGRLPRFELDAGFSGAGQDIRAGATSTGEKGFVSFQNQAYVLSEEVFGEFKRSFERAQRQQGAQGQSLASLGIDPRKWLRDPRNEGEAEVAGTETIKITGGVDVPRLLEDVNQALRRARALGAQGGRSLPERLTEEQKRQVQEAVKALNVEIYTGKDDKILRRMVVALDVAGAQARGQQLESAKIRFDMTLAEVNEDQDIQEPQNPKPFDELASQLQGLGFGAGGGASGGAGGGSGSGASGGASSEALERYSDCIRDAGSDAQKAQKCADLLTP